PRPKSGGRSSRPPESSWTDAFRRNRRLMENWKTIRTWPREEMLKRVARFRKLKGSDGGLPDSKLPECRRKLYAVIGFQPPETGDSPVGANASAMPAISIAEGFNLGYCRAKPGKG